MSNDIDRARLRALCNDRSHGRISRRTFLAGASALGFTMTAGGILTPLAFAATPKRGGRMVLAMGHGATSDTTDPATLVNGYQWTLSYAMTNTLTEIDADMKVVPSLAESWESSPDAARWTFRLRKGVEFQNGRPFTATDVIASVRHHMGEDSKSFIKPIVDQIESMKADGDHVVSFTLTSGDADFPFSLDSAGFCIYPARPDGTMDWESEVGTGGYILKEYDPGVRARLERNPNYWNGDRAFVDEVELLTVADPTARTNALISGAVDAIDQADLKTASLLARKPGIHLEEVSGPLHYTFPMRTDMAPFDNNDVRLALKHAIDRQEILDKVLHGHGSIGNDSPIGSSYRYYASEVEPLPYDPDKAKYHVDKAGLGKLTLDLSAADAAFAGAVDAAVLYREHAAKAGIEINVVREPNDGYWSNVWMKKPWGACYWGGYATENEMFTTGYSAGAAWNDTFWTDEQFEKLRLAARAELDEGKRRTMYGEMQRIVRDRGGVVVPMFANAVMARNEKVAHGKLSPKAAFDGRRIIERWWVA